MQNHSLTSGQSKMGSCLNPSPYVFEKLSHEVGKKKKISNFSLGRYPLMLTLRQNKSYAESQPY